MNNRRVGADWEHEAVGYLEDNGYTILETNYRCRAGEIDIIGDDDGTLVFVEVKYRKDSSYGSPFEAVTPKKQRTIRKVAQFYMCTNRISDTKACRFDVIGILGNNIELIKDAF